MGGVQFVAVNVTGSNNNFDRTSEMDDEVHARMTANEAWLAEAVGIAISERARALVLFFHANPLFERDGRPSSRRDGFLTWRALLGEAAVRFQGPLLIVHGDSHKHRIDHPLRIPKSEATFSNVTRLEVFGAPVSNWSRVTISGDAPATVRIASGKKTEGGNP